MALFRHHIDAEATALAWTRTVDTEQQQWVGKRLDIRVIITIIGPQAVHAQQAD